MVFDFFLLALINFRFISVSGFSIEATMNTNDKGQCEKSKMRALFYFENSAYLTISYIQERDKLLNTNPS